MREILKSVKQKLVAKYRENTSSNEILKSVKQKLVAKYLKNSSSRTTKRFKPRIKARIRKNKHLITKNINNLFDWVKGAQLIELKKCITDEDPVRPELDNTFRRS